MATMLIYLSPCFQGYTSSIVPTICLLLVHFLIGDRFHKDSDQVTTSRDSEPPVKVSISDDPYPKNPAPDDQDVPVDESLFACDDVIDEECGEAGGGCEGGVAVDESLFDIDTLQDLDLEDPSILAPPTS